VNLFDSELKVMSVLWRHGNLPAKEIAAILHDEVGWSKTTTYTVIKKCLDKGALQRIDPGWVCHPLITKAQAQEFETATLVNKMYDGAPDQLVAALLSGKKLDQAAIDRLKLLVKEL